MVLTCGSGSILDLKLEYGPSLGSILKVSALVHILQIHQANKNSITLHKSLLDHPEALFWRVLCISAHPEDQLCPTSPFSTTLARSHTFSSSQSYSAMARPAACVACRQNKVIQRSNIYPRNELDCAPNSDCVPKMGLHSHLECIPDGLT